MHTTESLMNIWYFFVDLEPVENNTSYKARSYKFNHIPNSIKPTEFNAWDACRSATWSHIALNPKFALLWGNHTTNIRYTTCDMASILYNNVYNIKAASTATS